jgi:hypothetical protein
MLTVFTSKGDTVLKHLWKTNAPLMVSGLLMLPALALALVGLIVDPRIVTGAPAWLKPAKFAISIAIYVFTLAWAFTLIPEWKKTRRIVGWTTAIAMVMELAIIDFQAFRGTTSHFNVGIPLDAVLFTLMGIAIIAQTLTSVVVAIAFWRQTFEDHALGWALRLGMTITIVGAFSGALMTRPTDTQLAAARAGQAMPVIGAHTVGAPDGGPGMPGTGWSTEHGDLRVPHFVGLHALQVLPLFAFVLKRRRLSTDARVRLILTAAGSYFALLAILLIQALRGQSVVAPDGPTIAAFIAWALSTVICGGMSVVRFVPIATSEAV